MHDISESKIFTEQRLQEIKENLIAVQAATIDLFETWNSLRQLLPTDFKVTRFFSNAIYWQLKAINTLNETGFTSCTPPILRCALENIARIIYYERIAPTDEKEKFLEIGHTTRLRAFGELLRRSKDRKRYKGKLALALSARQVEYALGVWSQLSAYTHVNMEEFEQIGDYADISGVVFPLLWIQWELCLTAGMAGISTHNKVSYITLILRTLLNQAQFINLIVTGHYAAVYPEIENTDLAQEFVDKLKALLAPHSQNSDLYSGPWGEGKPKE